MTYYIGSDTIDGKEMEYCNDIADALKEKGEDVQVLEVGPNKEAVRNEHGAGDILIFLVGGGQAGCTWASFVKSVENTDDFCFTIAAYAGWTSNEKVSCSAGQSDELVAEWDCTGGSSPFYQSWMPDYFQGETMVTFCEKYSKYISYCCSDESAADLGQKIVSNQCGTSGDGSGSTSSGGGAQIKDITFEKCIRRICAATDSVFLVENNAAVLFPYTDWMAFTLRQKINAIKSNEIDPNVFTMEYGNDGFYNKVTIAWGGNTLPQRFAKDTNKLVKQVSNYTMNDIYKNLVETSFNYDKWTKLQQDIAKGRTGQTVNKKNKTTQTVTEDNDGTLLLSEQYDAFVEKYGEMEKRIESAAPDYETAQYIVNALLIQYIRDYNHSCKCRAIGNRKYIGGTFYAVENPFTKQSELFYLNGYSLRTQKNEALYYDLDFRYGPESAEEILDYQTLAGGGSSGAGTGANTGGSASEEQIWQDASKCKWAQDQPDCSTQDPDTAKKHYDEYTEKGEEVHFDCYGMSAYLYGRFNKEASIPCQVVGDAGHHVVMLDRGNGFESTREEYRDLDMLFRWRSSQNTNVLLPAPNTSGSTSSGNTDNGNTNGGNR